MSDANHETDEKALRALIRDTIEGTRAKDVERVLAHYADDVETFDLVTPLVNRGKGALRERLAQWFGSFSTAIDYDHTETTLAVSGDVAFNQHLTHVHATQVAGAVVDMWFRETVGYRKIAGRWQIVHQHSSVPIDMTSGLGRMDLKP